MDECCNPVINLDSTEAAISDIKQNFVTVNDDTIEQNQQKYPIIEQNEEISPEDMGQTESKKFSKKQQSNKYAGSGIQTKGTEMSFGFRKKINSTPKKLKKFLEGKDNKNKNTSSDENHFNGNRTSSKGYTEPDANGNAENSHSLHVERVDLSTEKSTGVLIQSKEQKHASNLAAAEQKSNKNIENNNYEPDEDSLMSEAKQSALSDAKRRSKSADTSGKRSADSATKKPPQKTLKFNLNQNTTLEYTRPKNFECQLGGKQLLNTARQHKTQFRTSSMKPSSPAQHVYSKFTLQTISLPKPEYAVPISLNAATPTSPTGYIQTNLRNASSERAKHREPMEQAYAAQSASSWKSRNAKQATQGTTRRSFSGHREISADSGIASIDVALDSNSNSGHGHELTATKQTRSRSRPRNLQMVMKSRHTFEVRHLDEPSPQSSGSSSYTEPLTLPKLPIDSAHTSLLPLNGLIRTNYDQLDQAKHDRLAAQKYVKQTQVQSTTSALKEKLKLDFPIAAKETKASELDILSSKTSSPGTCSMISWCNAGESLAMDSSNKSSSISAERKEVKHEELEAEDTLAKAQDPVGSDCERLKNIYDSLNDTKFAKMAFASSEILLEDETSPSVSLASSPDSDETPIKPTKTDINVELPEDHHDDKICNESGVISPNSPGSPTHASNSLSLSDCGNLIDDEIADQPDLLHFDRFTDSQEAADRSTNSCKEKADTPTIKEIDLEGTLTRNKTCNLRVKAKSNNTFTANKSQPWQSQDIERAESLNTLSPCESICSDDLIMNFDLDSSLESITGERLSRNLSAALSHNDSAEKLSLELENIEALCLREKPSISKLRIMEHGEKDNIIDHLPTRAIRLLNRTRLQDIQQQCAPQSYASDSDNSTACKKVRPRNALKSQKFQSDSTPATPRHKLLQNIAQNKYNSEAHNSKDDLMIYDKSFRNAMIQDVQQLKNQLLHLRSVLQNTETLNPFESADAQLNTSCGIDLACFGSINSSSQNTSDGDNSIQELADLRRQVVYLQSQMDDRERTIRLQKELIEKLLGEQSAQPHKNREAHNEQINAATQTERTRPLTIGAESLSRSKPEYTSYITQFPALYRDSTTIVSYQNPNGENLYNSMKQTRCHTIISTTLKSYNQKLVTSKEAIMPASSWHKAQTQPSPPANGQTQHKPVRITMIGELENPNHKSDSETAKKCKANPTVTVV